MNHVKLPLATLALTALLAACGQVPQAPAAPQTASQTGPQDLSGPGLPQVSNLTPLPHLSGQAIRLPALRAQDVSPNAVIVGLKVLVLSAGANDSNLPPVKAMLDNVGVPYDVLDTAPAGNLTSATLINADGSGKYQGVVLTTGALSYESSPGVFASGLDYSEWLILWGYERDYQVRQLSMYTYPSTWPEDYGLRAVTSGASADVSPTAASAGVLTDLKAGSVIPIRNAYNYPSSVAVVAGVTTTPLLTDTSGNVLAATSTDAAGRERLALTFAQNQYFLGSQLLGYGLVNWLTKGVYLGEYRRFDQLDSDDWFLDGDEFDPVTKTVRSDVFYLSAKSAFALRDGQLNLRARFPVASEFKYAIAFNGVGAVTSAPKNCAVTAASPSALTSASRCLATDFDWVSHTFDHDYMDFLSYAESYAEMAPNLNVARTLGLQVSSKSLITGDVSGLGWYSPANSELAPKVDYGLGASNKNMLRAAQAVGIQYIASNHSVASHWDPNCANCGMVHPLNSAIFLVPRWPVNLAYHSTNPTEETAWYNSVYAPGGSAPYWDHALTYQEILDKESDLALSHVLTGGAYPHFVHVDNFNQYTPGRSLAYDWQEALLTKYSKYSTLPMKTLRWDDLGPYMAARTSFMKSGVSGVWNRSLKSVTVTSPKAASVFVTGAVGGSSSVYAGKTISQLSVAAGGTSVLNTP